MVDPIDDSFYLSIFDRARTAFLAQRDSVDDQVDAVERVRNVLADRNPENGLVPADAALLLSMVRAAPIEEARALIISAAAQLRYECFGDDVATMVPIEVTSYCASGCKFCGWRSNNKDMVRLAISEEAVREQAKILAAQGFSHFEIAGGDHLSFLKNDLAGLIAGLKEETSAVNPEARVSLCLVPMHEQQYADLRDVGLDCVLTWQETYDKELYDFHIPTGPKATGIDLDFNITRDGNGYLQRLKSQELAIRCGLQAGLGAMIGLSPITEADMLSVIMHGQKLLSHYEDGIQPLIIGMPAWNPITTVDSDNRYALGFDFEVEGNFELLSAIYLLAFPDRHAWVFANGRVAPEVQAACVRTAACFTSTCVQIAPGAYLDLDAQLGTADKKRMFVRSTVEPEKLTKERVLAGEQFVHYYLTHGDFLDMFSDRGLEVVNDRSLLLI